jgi:epoxyqueuosine reductase
MAQIMSIKIKNELAQSIIDKAIEFGADLAGVANVEDLKRSPSHEISEKIPEFNGVGTIDVENRKRGVVRWPEGARTAIVIGSGHPFDRPELDWWATGDSGGNTAGNRLLMKTVSKLAIWLGMEQGVQCFKLPYHIEHGGVYMKDAAVLAGLGCIGKNNMLVTPQHGPRLRLRVMLTDAELPSMGMIDFDPCEACHMPCRVSCPQNAFSEKIYSKAAYGLDQLPGRSGVYSRLRCNQQMYLDESNVEEVNIGDENGLGRVVKYCRECELVCPVGLNC